jgi:hypothetical protein
MLHKWCYYKWMMQQCQHVLMVILAIIALHTHVPLQ